MRLPSLLASILVFVLLVLFLVFLFFAFLLTLLFTFVFATFGGELVGQELFRLFRSIGVLGLRFFEELGDVLVVRVFDVAPPVSRRLSTSDTAR